MATDTYFAPPGTTPEQQPKMLFIATHPRSTSTALERAFLTRSKDDTVCVHEPFGDAFYFGPERMSTRFGQEECKSSPYGQTTFADVVGEIGEAASKARKLVESKGGNKEPVVVIKDMAQYIVPPEKRDWYTPAGSRPTNTDAQGNVAPAPSFSTASGTAHTTHTNPTVVPGSVLNAMTFVFLVRAPHLAAPSYLRCCIPPLSARTGFDHFRASEVGIRELRIFFDHLRRENPNHQLLVIDSEDLCRTPKPVIEAVCKQAGIEFKDEMLQWEENCQAEVDMFAKWKGFHDDALNSKGFGQNRGAAAATGAEPSKEFKVDFEAWEEKWRQSYSEEQVKEIRQAVEASLEDYLYLRQFKAEF